MTTPFRTSRRVEFADTDMAGIVHFANFFRWMESAEVELLRARGLSVNFHWEGRKIGFPRVSASCDFIKPVTFGDEVEITVRVARVGRKSVTYAFEFFKAGEPVARGQVSAVCCLELADKGLESIAIPPAMRAMLEQA